MDNLDPATRAELVRGQELTNFVASPAWADIRRKLFTKLTSLDSLSGMEFSGKSADEIVREVSIRAAAIEMVLDWVKEIEGDAAASQTAAEAMLKSRTDEIMTIM